MRQLLPDRSIPLSIAALALGVALQVNDGLFSPVAVALLGVALISTIAAIWCGSDRSTLTVPILFVCVFVQLGLLLTDFPGSHHEQHTWRDYRLFLALIVGCIAVVVLAIRWPRVAFVALLSIYVFAGVWLLRETPSPYMDVFIFQRDACAAVMTGTNPYTITYPDLYGGEGSFVYGAGLVRDGRVLFAFPYMPLTLWWNLLGHATAGDYRFAQLLAAAISAILIAATTWSRASVLAASILLFTPRGFFVVDQGWTEPLMVMLLAATVLCAIRYPRILPYALGLLLASKQYMIMLIPLAPLLFHWRDWRFSLKAIATACIVTAPLALWNISAFWDNAVVLQFRQPFRSDALSFAAALSRAGFPRFQTGVAVVAALAVAVASAAGMKRSARAFSLAVAVTFMSFFALNKQAFANYYFFVIGALCCAIATADQGGLRRAQSRRISPRATSTLMNPAPSVR
ncbi:hypothetical protein BH09PLA1_BH09PLA1_28990 [soil metagenome]